MEFNSAGDLTKVTDPDSSSRTWNYSATHSMLGEVDQSGRSEQANYDAFGRVAGAILKDGALVNVTPLAIDGLRSPASINQVTSQTDELGRKTIYDIDPLTGNVRSSTRVIGAIGGTDDLITGYTYTT